MADRVAKLRTLLEKTPDDVFLRYSLAMELAGGGLAEEAQHHFGRCIEQDPHYLPAYVELGKSFRAAGLFTEARQAWEAGLKLALAKNEKHTEDHIKGLLEGLPRP